MIVFVDRNQMLRLYFNVITFMHRRCEIHRKTGLLVEESKRGIVILDGVPRCRLSVSVRLPFISPDGMEHHVLVTSVRWIVDPHMHEAITIIIRADFELSQDDGTIRSRPTADQHKVAVEVNLAYKFMIGQSSGSRPHPRLMYVPFTTTLADFAFNLVQNDAKRFDRVRVRCMRRVEIDLLFGG